MLKKAEVDSPKEWMTGGGFLNCRAAKMKKVMKATFPPATRWRPVVGVLPPPPGNVRHIGGVVSRPPELPASQTSFDTNMNMNVNPAVSLAHAEPPCPSRSSEPDPYPPSLPALKPAAAAPGPDVPRRPLRVLCIDDDEQILDVMKGCLAHFEHHVRVASGGKYGIELFNTAILKSEPYDVVITDLNMPDVNGCAVARAIKAECPDIPIIMMTGTGADIKEAALMSAPVNAVVNKPPRMQELNTLILRIARPAQSPS